MTQEFGTAESYRSASGSCIQKKNCRWIHALQTTRQLRKHRSATFGCCTNSRNVLHELDTFGISLVLPLHITNPFTEACDVKLDFRVRSFLSKLYMQRCTRGCKRERSKPRCWTPIGGPLAWKILPLFFKFWLTVISQTLLIFSDPWSSKFKLLTICLICLLLFKGLSSMSFNLNNAVWLSFGGSQKACFGSCVIRITSETRKRVAEVSCITAGLCYTSAKSSAEVKQRTCKSRGHHQQWQDLHQILIGLCLLID